MRKLIGFLVLSFSILVWVDLVCSDEPDNTRNQKSVSVFPILMYDTDIGVGYGGKAKFVNYLSKNESFDVMLFNSSKGERTYLFTFSIPDFEIRQGKVYPLSFDLKAEYSKLLKMNYFGIGPDSSQDDLTVFTHEKKELQLTLGRGFSPQFVLEAMYVFKSVRYFSVERNRAFTKKLEEVGEQFSPYASLALKYDTSDSQINPRQGFRFIFRNDLASKWLGNTNATYYRFSLDFRKYNRLFGHNDVLAVRALVQKISGDKIPLFEMSSLGGGSEMNAMRGFKMNRFQDKGKFLVNVEYRFPIWKKIGGNVFSDAGLVWPSWSRIKFEATKIDIGWGLRYYLQNFVVRFDMGFGPEGTGIYFNFGHIF